MGRIIAGPEIEAQRQQLQTRVEAGRIAEKETWERFQAVKAEARILPRLSGEDIVEDPTPEQRQLHEDWNVRYQSAKTAYEQTRRQLAADSQSLQWLGYVPATRREAEQIAGVPKDKRTPEPIPEPTPEIKETEIKNQPC